MSYFEKKILNFIYKNKFIIFIFVFSVLALFVRIKMLKFESGDYTYGFLQWFNYFKYNGGITGLGNAPESYNMPYMTLLSLLSYIPGEIIYIVKSLPIVFDFLSGIMVYKIIKLVCSKRDNKQSLATFGYCIFLLLPTVIMNSSLWGQCDSVYTCFAFLSLYLLLKNKYFWSFVFLGISFAFKLQFVFILPVYVIYYFMEKKFSILNFLLIPLVNVVLCIPAMIYGKSLLGCLSIYFSQASTFSEYNSLNLINLGQLFRFESTYIYPFLQILAFGSLGIMLLYCMVKNVKFNSEKILTLSLWSIMITTFLLPGMHDRYLYMAEILSLIVFLAYKKHLLTCIILNFYSIYTYSGYLIGGIKVNYQYLVILYLLVIIYFTINLTNVLCEKENEKMLNIL